MIQVENLTRGFAHGREMIRALDGVTFVVEKGEYVTVTGPSGSGKSTLLMSMGGLLHPTSGRVVFDGVDIYRQSPKALALFRTKTIGFVFQQFHLVPYLTAWENVALPLMLNGNNRGKHKPIAVGLLERLGLGSRLDHKPSELSVGQQQRVAMARTLANNPSVILADEPTGSLDPGLANDLVGLLKDLNSEGKTIVLVTHSRELAATGDRCLALLDGKVVQSAEGALVH
ncbi:MAG: ABC transporter ATP-binding protein [candidate division Zixibacteria bacterium]|nr:ABC transporter ATP-binding protein [candidate division Zixibacteria bacterium]